MVRTGPLAAGEGLERKGRCGRLPLRRALARGRKGPPSGFESLLPVNPWICPCFPASLFLCFHLFGGGRGIRIEAPYEPRAQRALRSKGASDSRGGSPSGFSTARRRAVGGSASKTTDASPPFESLSGTSFAGILRRSPLAVGEGFEPPVPFWGTAVFKTAAFDRSAIPPAVVIIPPGPPRAAVAASGRGGQDEALGAPLEPGPGGLVGPPGVDEGGLGGGQRVLRVQQVRDGAGAHLVALLG
jgi:hypothetical protein